MITSGITSGALTMPEKSVRPKKRRYFTSANAARVPSTTEAQAVSSAIFSDSHRPADDLAVVGQRRVPLSEKPRQTLGSRESLNEKTTSATIGRYRNRIAERAARRGRTARSRR